MKMNSNTESRPKLSRLLARQSIRLINPVIRDAAKKKNWSGKKCYILAVNSISGGGGGGGGGG